MARIEKMETSNILLTFNFNLRLRNVWHTSVVFFVKIVEFGLLANSDNILDIQLF